MPALVTLHTWFYLNAPLASEHWGSKFKSPSLMEVNKRGLRTSRSGLTAFIACLLCRCPLSSSCSSFYVFLE